MDHHAQFEDARDHLVEAPGRRQSLQSLLAAGLALLATVGLGTSGEAKKH